MLAELVGVPVNRIRTWQRKGWIIPVEQSHRLAHFDFAGLTAARQLAALHRSGASAQLIGKKLKEIQRQFSDVRQPLAELTLILDGKTLLVRRVGALIEPSGQLRLDFDAAEQDEESHLPATLPSPAMVLSRQPMGNLQLAATEQLAAWAAELDEAGDLKVAAEVYRAALAAGGPHPEICFQLAELL